MESVGSADGGFKREFAARDLTPLNQIGDPGEQTRKPFSTSARPIAEARCAFPPPGPPGFSTPTAAALSDRPLSPVPATGVDPRPALGRCSSRPGGRCQDGEACPAECQGWSGLSDHARWCRARRRWRGQPRRSRHSQPFAPPPPRITAAPAGSGYGQLHKTVHESPMCQSCDESTQCLFARESPTRGHAPPRPNTTRSFLRVA